MLQSRERDMSICSPLTRITCIGSGGRGGGARWLSGRASDSGGRGVRNLPPSCCVLVKDTLLPESTGNTRKAVAPSRHDSKIVDWDVKPQHKTKKTCIG